MSGLISGLTGSAKKARKSIEKATAIANKKQADALATNLETLKPQVDYGNEAISDLMNRLGLGTDTGNENYNSLLKNFTGEDLASTPGYQFGMDQGMQALNRQAAAKGGLLSGAALKGAERFGQDYAGTKFQEGYNRDLTDKNRIATFLGNAGTMGINAINTGNDMRSSVAKDRANNALGVGNAYAAQHTAQGSIWDGVLNQGVQAAMMAATGGMSGLGSLGAGMGAGAGAATTGGVSSALAGGIPGFSNNLLNPNFAKNYMGLG